MDIMEFSSIRSTGELPVRIPSNIINISDTNGAFNPYLGVWETQVNGNTITFNISKISKNYIRDISLDALQIEYTVVDQFGNMILDSNDSSDSVTTGFLGMHFEFSSRYTGIWGYSDTQHLYCGSSGIFTLGRSINLSGDNFLEFNYFKDKDNNSRLCSNGYQKPPFPFNTTLIFTKL